MDPMSSGLRFRLRRAARQTAEQHQHIHELVRDLEAALTKGDPGRVADVFERYRATIRAHFTLEEDVFFPALHGLHPEHAGALEALIEEHGTMKSDLEALASSLAREALVPFAGGLRALADAMREHEGREEQLVAVLVRLSEDAEGESSPSSSGTRSPS